MIDFEVPDFVSLAYWMRFSPPILPPQRTYPDHRRAVPSPPPSLHLACASTGYVVAGARSLPLWLVCVLNLSKMSKIANRQRCDGGVSRGRVEWT